MFVLEKMTEKQPTFSSKLNNQTTGILSRVLFSFHVLFASEFM